MVLHTESFAPSHSLRKKLRAIQRSMRDGGPWQIRFDGAFEQVMRACGGPRADGSGTWISEGMIRAYTALHRLGYAHSVELWKDDELVGGAYGLCIGRMFYGESMFARVTDASKIALAYLVHFLKMNGVPIIDCQQETSHLASLGATAMPRDEFVRKVAALVGQTAIEDWKPFDLS
jgi:leucyl/phenylalanyl-tRNA--protein transferase